MICARGARNLRPFTQGLFIRPTYPFAHCAPFKLRWFAPAFLSDRAQPGAESAERRAEAAPVGSVELRRFQARSAAAYREAVDQLRPLVRCTLLR